MNDDFNLILKSFEKACEQLQLEPAVRDSIVDLSINSEDLTLDEVASIKKQCLLFIELYTKLMALSSNDSNFIQHLLTTTNTVLKGQPIDLIQTPEGLEQVVNYYSSISKS